MQSYRSVSGLPANSRTISDTRRNESGERLIDTLEENLDNQETVPKPKAQTKERQVRSTSPTAPAPALGGETAVALPPLNLEQAHPEASGTPDDKTWSQRYVVRAPLGEGGMGEVQLVADRRIGRDVAMKVIRSDHLRRRDLVRRFMDEARVQGQLEHPAVVPVYDIGLAPDGNAYFTMKRVKGKTLAARIGVLVHDRDAAFHAAEMRRLLQAFASVCLAVHFAHTHGVLHRDLKPANLMLGDYGEVYVLDWGLAKLVRDADGDGGALDHSERRLAMSGALMGTAGYMAPEQAQGETLGPFTDVYALGAILFEILTLTPLHRGATFDAVIRSTIEGVDARPSVRAPDRQVPPELEAICVRATALRPEDRFSTARELHDAVENYLAGHRDIERRRALAATHADEAARAAAHAVEGGEHAEAERSRAFHELARALALDPENREAHAALDRLFTSPPKALPESSDTELERLLGATQCKSLRLAAVAYAAYAALAPFRLSVPGGATAFGLLSELPWIACAALALHLSRATQPSAPGRRALVGLSSLAVLLSAFSPMGAMPLLVLANNTGYLLSADRGVRRLSLTLGILVIVIAALSQGAGLLGAATHESLRIYPYALSATLLVSVWLVVSWIRRSLAALQESLTIQTWQLRQLLPTRTQESASLPPPNFPECGLL